MAQPLERAARPRRATFRVYELETAQVRLDSTTISSYTAVNADGLLQLGHSKDKRPEDAQLKIQWPSPSNGPRGLEGPLLAMLDPQVALLGAIGMPLATQVVAGSSAEGGPSRGHDPLYLPSIRAVQDSIGVGGKTYIGDVKMAALNTRASLAQCNDYYLCPLGEHQLSEAQQTALIDAALCGEVKVSRIKLERRNVLSNELVAREEIAWGYCVNVMLSAKVDDDTLSWRERRLIIQSKAYAKAEAAQLDKRLARAEAKLHDGPAAGHFLVLRKPPAAGGRQGKRRLDAEQTRAAAQQLIVDHRVQGLLSATVSSTNTERVIRHHKDAPARTQTHVNISIKIERHHQAIKTFKDHLGWRIYATNHPKLSLSQIVLAYREQYRIEDGISRLKAVRPV